tara:strand:- start:54 stop:527 length:474 start_codon:yes stop_codon:yes gene_type:complete
MQEKIIENIVKLRASVAFLGEKNKWWQTKFFDSSSKEFLTYIFPRSKNPQLTQAVEAIQHKVDSEVGANYYHLFRLKITYEELIKDRINSVVLDKITSNEDAENILSQIAGGVAIDEAPGPKNIGTIDNLDESLIQAFAAEYLAAFKNQYVVHPYLN